MIKKYLFISTLSFFIVSCATSQAVSPPSSPEEANNDALLDSGDSRSVLEDGVIPQEIGAMPIGLYQVNDSSFTVPSPTIIPATHCTGKVRRRNEEGKVIDYKADLVILKPNGVRIMCKESNWEHHCPKGTTIVIEPKPDLGTTVNWQTKEIVNEPKIGNDGWLFPQLTIRCISPPSKTSTFDDA